MTSPQTKKRKASHAIKSKGPLKLKSNYQVGLSQIVSKRQPEGLLSVYTLSKELGRGEYGVTRLCKHDVTGENFACKSMTKGVMTQKQTEAVEREVEVMEHLAATDTRVENIVRLKEIYEDQDSIHIVMERCAGGELFKALSERGATSGGFYSETDAASLFRKVVEAVNSCHAAGVMHGDVKLENILFLTKETKADSPIKLIDFGLSRFFKEGDVFEECVGTPSYMAPEVWRQCYSKEADLWSAGVILYILLSGDYPFEGKSNDDWDGQIRDAVLYDDIDFSRCPWPEISTGAKHLVRLLLTRDRRKRLTALEVLRHPWLQARLREGA